MPDFPSLYRLHPNCPPDSMDVRIPGSKSYTNRALLLAALAKGESVLRNALFSDDTHWMIEALAELGVEIQADKAARTLTIRSQGKPTRLPSEPLYCGNAGTAIRFLTPFCALGEGEVILTGNARMQERPIHDLLEGMRGLGVEVEDIHGTGCPPIRIRGGGMRGGKCRIDGTRSSQYFSALLLSAARMKEGLEIEIEGDLVSKPYIDMTLAILRRFGIESVNQNYQHLSVPAGQEPQAAAVMIEGDASAATYFLALAAIGRTTVRVHPLPEDTCQGDAEFARILSRMGCRQQHKGEFIEVRGGELHGIEADLNAMSDTAQTLAAVALFAEGSTTIRNIANARIKETDRIAAIAREITRLGGTVEEYPDGLTIHPASAYHAADIETYDDHRMAMSFAVTALRIPGIGILNPGCVTKTFPEFFEVIAPWIRCEAKDA